jgi:hypothetical protein
VAKVLMPLAEAAKIDAAREEREARERAAAEALRVDMARKRQANMEARVAESRARKSAGVERAAAALEKAVAALSEAGEGALSVAPVLHVTTEALASVRRRLAALKD